MVAAAAVVTAGATPLFARLAAWRGLVVAPREDRWHKRSTPLLGGAAIALGALVGLVVAPDLAVVFVGAGMAFALGLLDDVRHLAPTTKLVGQVLIASGLALAGVHVRIIEFVPLAFLITVFWIVIVMNALNLLDNMDGLSAGVSAIAALALGLTALGQSPLAAVLAAATAGSALGFLVHNFHPAKVFMGDAGSLLLGFMLAVVALLHTASGAASLGLAVLGPLAVLALPLFDTTLVTTARGLAGMPIMQGGRDHSSHRLAALGLSDSETVLLLYGVAGALAILGIIADQVATLIAPLFALAIVALILFGAFLWDVDVYGKARAAGQGTIQSPFRHSLHVYGRFGTEIGLDVVLLTTAYYLSWLIRFESQPQAVWLPLFEASVPLVVGAQLGILVLSGVYRTLWRFFSPHDAMAILRATVLGTGIGALGILALYRFEDYSRAVLLLDALIAAVLLIGSRSFLLWLRHWFATRPRAGELRVLIVGANEGGALALRLLGRRAAGTYRAVGFIDDDPGKRYRRVGGVPIVGTTADLVDVAHRLSVDLVVLATEGADDESARIRALCEELGVECRDVSAAV